MRKLFFTAALVAAMFSAKAQTNIVTSKCGCDENPKLIWAYQRNDTSETITNPDQRGFIELDWKNGLVVIESGDTYPIEKSEVDAIEPFVTVWYENEILRIHYDSKSAYRYHEFRSR